MESFTLCAVQMLREFRAVLRITPIPITQLRLLQLAALNMFAIESTQLQGECGTEEECFNILGGFFEDEIGTLIYLDFGSFRCSLRDYASLLLLYI